MYVLKFRAKFLLLSGDRIGFWVSQTGLYSGYIYYMWPTGQSNAFEYEEDMLSAFSTAAGTFTADTTVDRHGQAENPFI